MSGVLGMRHGHPLPDDVLEPCGTLAAYRRHLRRGVIPDRDCRDAAARAWQDRLASGWRRPSRAVRVHQAARGGTAACGRHEVAVTGDAALVTCLDCREGHRRAA